MKKGEKMSANFELLSPARMRHYCVMTCYRCQRHLPEYAAFCPRCGTGVRRGGKKRLALFLFGGAAVFMFLMFFIASPRVSSSPAHSVDIDPFGSGSSLTPSPIRVERSQPTDMQIQFDDRNMTPEQAKQLREMIERSVREHR